MAMVLSPNRAFVLGVAGQVIAWCGPGLCDAALARIITALQPFHYDKALFLWDMIATGENPANTAGDDLHIDSQQSVQLFTAGVGESDTAGNIWWTKTIADTSLFRGGVPADRPYQFLGMGLAVDFDQPFQRGGTQASASDPQFYSAFLQDTNAGPTYGFLLIKYHLTNTAFTMLLGDSGVTYRVGLAAHYPSWGGPTGGPTVRNGAAAMPGTYLPWTSAFCLGNRDDINQLTFTAVTGQAATVESNGANPTDLPTTTAETPDGTVYVPLRVLMVGMYICQPAVYSCGVLTPEEAAAQRAAMNIPG